ncbi:hypothetical protein NKR23_g244 [Pleurostoma richardsiae]|uniref:Uncharacterized protein n=1 Tax=Pleurostoma richardsiae TaxID=41990 RepID=A0AA38S6Y4_9PEZI|nr:hypothetical protein NKR23_g244 [Pleurostoma richardsiae]
MLAKRSTLLLGLGALRTEALRYPHRVLGTRVGNCTIPSWSVDDLSVRYSGTDTVPGNATFTLANSATNTSEALACSLPFNSLCYIDGSANVTLQLMLETAYITVNQTWICGDQAGNTTS